MMCIAIAPPCGRWVAARGLRWKADCGAKSENEQLLLKSCLPPSSNTSRAPGCELASYARRTLLFFSRSSKTRPWAEFRHLHDFLARPFLMRWQLPSTQSFRAARHGQPEPPGDDVGSVLGKVTSGIPDPISSKVLACMEDVLLA